MSIFTQLIDLPMGKFVHIHTSLQLFIHQFQPKKLIGSPE
jgi:hypothetical protein